MRFFENIYMRRHTSFCSSYQIEQALYKSNKYLLEMSPEMSPELSADFSDIMPAGFKLPSVRNFSVRKKVSEETCFLIKGISDDLTFIAVITDTPVRMIAAYKDSVFAGYALYEVHPSHIYLDKCFVKESFRSLGIAGKLLTALKQTEEPLILEGIPLFVYAYPFDRGDRLSQEALNKFYTKHGFGLIPHVAFWK